MKKNNHELINDYGNLWKVGAFQKVKIIIETFYIRYIHLIYVYTKTTYGQFLLSQQNLEVLSSIRWSINQINYHKLNYEIKLS